MRPAQKPATASAARARDATIASQRLANQHIANPTLTDPARVVASLGAVQAQDYTGGLWAVGLRTRESTEADVERALARRDILRTWPMRGTLHFVAAADARWMLDLLAARVMAAAAPRARQLELDASVFARSRTILVKALEGNRQLTRADVYALLESRRISSAAGRGLHIVLQLALEGVLCFGAREGRQQTFALLAEWAPGSKPKPREESLAELARRYFASHGPATWRDFAWWSGLRTREAREALDLARPHVERDSFAGEEFWRGASNMPVAAKAASAHLLPPFDEFTVAYKDRTAVLHPDHAARAQSGGMLSPTVVVAGRVRGTWTRTQSGDNVRISPTLFDPLTAADQRLLTAAAERYGRFRGLVPRLAGSTGA